MKLHHIIAWLAAIVLFLFTIFSVTAMVLTTTGNPWTGKPDYYAKYNSSDWGAGGGLPEQYCPAGLVMQNATNAGPECISPIAGSAYTNGTGLLLNGLQFNISPSYNTTAELQTLFCSVNDNTSLWINASGQQTAINALVSSNGTTNSRVDSVNTTAQSLLSSNTTTNGRVDSVNSTVQSLLSSNTTTNGRVDSVNSTLTTNASNQQVSINNLISSNTTTNSRVDTINATIISIGNFTGNATTWSTCGGGQASFWDGSKFTCVSTGGVGGGGIVTINSTDWSIIVQNGSTTNVSINTSWLNTTYDARWANKTDTVTNFTNLWSNASSQETEIGGLQSSNTTAFANISTLFTNATNQENEITALKNSNTTAFANISTLFTNATNQENEITALKNSNTTAFANISTLFSNASAQETEIATAQTTANGKATTGSPTACSAGSFITAFTLSSGSAPTSTCTAQAIPYQSSAAGWSNDTTWTNTSLKVNISNSLYATNLNVSGVDIYIGTSKVCTSTNGLCSASVPNDAQFVTLNVTTKLNASSGDNHVYGFNSSPAQCDYTTGKSMYNVTTGQMDCGTDQTGGAGGYSSSAAGWTNNTLQTYTSLMVNMSKGFTDEDKSIQYNTTTERLCIGLSVADCTDTPNTRILIGGDIDSYNNQTDNNDNSSYAGLSISTSRGTSAVPLPNLNGDFIGGIRWYSYNGSDYFVDGTIRGYVANTTNNHSMNVIFSITNDSTNTQLEYLRANTSGLYLNTTKCSASQFLTTDAASGKLSCGAPSSSGVNYVRTSTAQDDKLNGSNVIIDGTLLVNGVIYENGGVEVVTTTTYGCPFMVTQATTMCYPNYLGTAIATGTLANVAGTPIHPGSITWSGTTAANSGYAFNSGITTILLNGSEEFRFSMLLTNDTVGNNTITYVGFVDSISAAVPADGAFFAIVTNNSGVFISGMTANNSDYNSTVNITWTNNVWFNGNIKVSPDANMVTFMAYNDTTLVWNATLNRTALKGVPLTVGRETGMGFVSWRKTAGTARMIGRIDYMIGELRTPRRIYG